MTVDEKVMKEAVALAAGARGTTSPNPWVGCVLVTESGRRFTGATQPPGGPHAEVAALAVAGAHARGATVYTTLEPCSHHGRTPPCSEALIAAGVSRVVVGVLDPDSQVSGRGIEQLRSAGVHVDVGVAEDQVEDQLAPYLHHRRTGRPWVVLKLAATLDGRTAAPDGTSRWITGAEARADAHRLRAESDAVLVGAGTVRADNPALTVRHVPTGRDQPLRVVLGRAEPDAAIQPCLEVEGDLTDVLDQLGAKGIVQLMVEGGPTVAGEFHRRGLVNQYALYLAPALMGGDDGRALLAGPGAVSIDEIWRGRIRGTEVLGTDLRIDLFPTVQGGGV